MNLRRVQLVFLLFCAIYAIVNGAAQDPNAAVRQAYDDLKAALSKRFDQAMKSIPPDQRKVAERIQQATNDFISYTQKELQQAGSKAQVDKLRGELLKRLDKLSEQVTQGVQNNEKVGAMVEGVKKYIQKSKDLVSKVDFSQYQSHADAIRKMANDIRNKGQQSLGSLSDYWSNITQKFAQAFSSENIEKLKKFAEQVSAQIAKLMPSK